MKFNFKKTEKPYEVSAQDWNSWHWQLRNSLKSISDFKKYFELSPEEQMVFESGQDVFNIRATPYYSKLARPSLSQDPIRKILMPTSKELSFGTQDLLDPLGEKKNNPVSRIVHRYPDRVLFLVTDICSVYCRYCTRKHFTGQEQAFIKEKEFKTALEYIKSKTGIREVILSGGDPLTLSNEQLFRVLTELRRLEHVEIIRIGTRMPVVCPMRVDETLVTELRKFKPVFLMTHFNHPRELTSEAATAIELFVDHGIPVFNQMVLLNGINNHPAIVQALSRRLLYLRAKPYYMFQCDPSEGTDHLRTSIEDSEEILKELWGRLSGLAMPQLSLDIPNGGGKVGLTPNYEISRDLNGRRYEGWDQVTSEYLNPPAQSLLKPLDAEEYFEEFESLKNAKETASPKW